jgi:hypothetical protein
VVSRTPLNVTFIHTLPFLFNTEGNDSGRRASTRVTCSNTNSESPTCIYVGQRPKTVLMSSRLEDTRHDSVGVGPVPTDALPRDGHGGGGADLVANKLFPSVWTFTETVNKSYIRLHYEGVF